MEIINNNCVNKEYRRQRELTKCDAMHNCTHLQCIELRAFCIMNSFYQVHNIIVDATLEQIQTRDEDDE